ncbi:uncharacterized protein L201_005435 [Kwoniella dendrophila CBS 6074]|uniref:Sensitive to high expression protein 9, mitochondrial n=1 Tax=Kwoniella dendrophila CBS 6074 TaxID=1295534 RepID=A0AAX4K025_9TREE
MAFRHAFPTFLAAAAGPSRNTVTRLLNPCSSKTSPFNPSQCLSLEHPCTRIAPLRRWNSSSASSYASKKKQEPEKEDDNVVWNLPPPPSYGPTAIEGQNTKNPDIGLPIPDNIATGSTSFSGTGSTINDKKFAEDPQKSISDKEKEDSTHNQSSPSETALPNYPTLPPSSSSTSSLDPLPKLASPNIDSNDVTKPKYSVKDSLQSLQSLKIPKSVNIPPEVKERIAEWSTTVLQHSKRVAKDAEKRLVELGLKVNQMTGYQEVERLKALVFEKEDNLQALRESAKKAKIEYDEAVTTRSNAQRDVNSLLERKHSWNDSDVLKFTQLVREDHSSTHLVSNKSLELKEKELKVDKSFNELMQTILQRYHEEQVWSDKIRSVSTWANLLGLALNAFIFLTAIVIVEPWKRKRLVNKLEEKISGLMNNVDNRLKGLESTLIESHSNNQTSNPSLPIITLPNQEDIKEEVPLVVQPIIDDTPAPIISPETLPTDTPPLDLAVSLPDTITPSSPQRIILKPLITTNIQGLPPYLDIVTQPSQERDMAIAGIAGAVMMGIAMTLGQWVFT